MDSVKVTIAVRQLIDRIREKYGYDAYIELFTDGSGSIRVRNQVLDTLKAEFDGLGELIKILEPETESRPSGLNRAGWGGLS